MEGSSDKVSLQNTSKMSVSSEEKDEKAPDSSDLNCIQKSKSNKAKKRKPPKDVAAPRQPLTGYVRYLNDRRESVRAANPNLPFAEITRLLASEWTNLAADKKQQYLDAAVQDKERYTKEFNAYKQTQAFKQMNEKRMKENKEESKNTSSQAISIRASHTNEMDLGNFDIPIFTEEFLDHNKVRDAELRQLRKSNTDYEQQNAILQKHIENVKGAIEKLEVEVTQQKQNNRSLEQYLDYLKTTLTNGFANVPLPATGKTPTFQTIDSYMTSLNSMLLENNSNDSVFLKTVKDTVASLEFNG